MWCCVTLPERHCRSKQPHHLDGLECTPCQHREAFKPVCFTHNQPLLRVGLANGFLIGQGVLRPFSVQRGWLPLTSLNNIPLTATSCASLFFNDHSPKPTGRIEGLGTQYRSDSIRPIYTSQFAVVWPTYL